MIRGDIPRSYLPYMCHDGSVVQIEKPIDLVLGDGHFLTATGRGKVVLQMLLTNGESK